jgi:predicted dienelactone hydrolase
MAAHHVVVPVAAPGAGVARPVFAADARVRAIVVAAPALGFTLAGDGARDVRVPVQLWRADADMVLPAPDYADAVRAALPVAPEFHGVPGAGHFDFLAPCSDALARVAPMVCSEAGGFDRAGFHVGFNRAVVGFFERTIEGRK